MSTETLRAELADRMAKVIDGAGGRAPASFTGDHLKVAEEVLRQMEWARQHCGEFIRVPAGVKLEEGKLVPLEEIPLTLAPEGWTP